MQSLRKWEEIFPEEDRRIYEGFGLVKQKPGSNPALLIVDVTEATCGSRRMEVPEAQKDLKGYSSGKYAFDTLDNIKKLLDRFRSKKLPVIYVKGALVNKYFCGSSTKVERGKTTTTEIHSLPIPKKIQPLASEYVLEKTKASAFFGTPLVVYLNKHNIDTLYIVGGTTSGCLRASVIDAFSYGYKVFVVEEGTFDRSQFSHLVNLFEINAKYADVISINDIF